jgi:peptide deformylase
VDTFLAISAELDTERLARRRAAFTQIVQWGDPVLRSQASAVSAFDDQLAAQIRRMADLMDDALGAGLAAPQVGKLQRLFVYRAEPEGPLGVVVNPTITRFSDEKITTEEGCLSIGRAQVWVPVERSGEVEVVAFDAKGHERTITAEGREAVILQHETDHLDGVLMLSRTAPEFRREALKTLRELG